MLEAQKERLVNAANLESKFQKKVQSYRGTIAAVAYNSALETIKEAPTVEAVPKAQYDELKEHYKKLLETANILDAALRQYQQKYGELED